MGKGEQTKQRIVAQAAPVFNTLGYSGTSMAELIKATGLEKGGIYNHFPSKEALALAAFDHAVAVVRARIALALQNKSTATERLLALVEFYEHYVEQPPIPGGCPIMNTAVEADDTDPELRTRAQAAMTDLQRLIGSIVKTGIASGELRGDLDPRAIAAVFTGLIEGAVLLGRLYNDPTPAGHITHHLRSCIASYRVHNQEQS